jgi:hypothetical protein
MRARTLFFIVIPSSCRFCFSSLELASQSLKLTIFRPKHLFLQYGPGSTQATFPSLSAGTFYRASVRAHNDAIDNGGWGAWSPLAVGSCVDGVDRPSVCGIEGLFAIGVPSTPLTLTLRPSGDRTLVAEWSRPVDTGPSPPASLACIVCPCNRWTRLR